MRRLHLSLVFAALAGCVQPADDPSTVKDLRVLGVRLDPPELMGAACGEDPNSFAAYARPVTYTALVLDPRGQGRTVHYELWACARADDSTCKRQSERVKLSEGDTPTGEVTLKIAPGAQLLPDKTPLLEKVLQRDPYHGLGGIREPLVLHLTAGAEEIWAQKLMVFSCPIFPDLKPNVNPELPGLMLQGKSWPEDSAPELSGPGPFEMLPEDFTALQEAYEVPSLELKPVHLIESWKLTWHTDLGRISPYETGGTDFGGTTERHLVKWHPPANGSAQDVTFWVVVRDGRGGETWIVRRAHWTP